MMIFFSEFWEKGQNSDFNFRSLFNLTILRKKVRIVRLKSEFRILEKNKVVSTFLVLILVRSTVSDLIKNGTK